MFCLLVLQLTFCYYSSAVVIVLELWSVGRNISLLRDFRHVVSRHVYQTVQFRTC